MILSRHRLLLGLLLASLVGWITLPVATAAEEGPPPAPKEEAAAEPSPGAAEQEEKPVAEPDPFAVPEGTAAELVEFLERAMAEQPKVADFAGFVEFSRKRAKAVQEAADKILAAGPTDEQAEKAIRAKLTVLTFLSRLREADALKALDALVEELTKAGRTQLAREARGAALAAKVQQVRDVESEDFQKLAEDVRKYLAEGTLQKSDVSLAMLLPQTAEFSGNPELAGQLYTEFAKLLATSEDQQIASLATRLEGAGRRLGLLGNTMKIEGATLDGKPFDWSSYGGKVVLVDFWATWCGPCRAEMPNVKEAYKVYHDRGFDVVGISLDRSLKALEEYVQKEEIPWVILLDQPILLAEKAGQTEQVGEDKPESTQPEAQREFVADYYGVLAIPTTVLVGKDGKVVSLSARGQELREQLAELLGPAEEPKDQTPADSEAAEPKKAEEAAEKP